MVCGQFVAHRTRRALCPRRVQHILKPVIPQSPLAFRERHGAQHHYRS